MKTIAELTTGYDRLGDSVIKSINLDYGSKNNQPVIKVQLECMSALDDYNWVYLEILFYGVLEFRIVSVVNKTIIVPDDLSITQSNGTLLFSFHLNDPSLLKSNDANRRAYFDPMDCALYISCKEFDFKEILPQPGWAE